MRRSGRFALYAAALTAVVVLLSGGMRGKAQAPNPMPPPLLPTEDTVRVTIVPGHVVTIWADARRVTMRHSPLGGEAVVEIDTSPRLIGKP